MTASTRPSVELDLHTPVWERVHTVAPLVLVGTREPDGRDDLAPKHMALPLGWQNYFGFVCTPRHSTYANAQRERGFTVSFPTAAQLVEASLAASPRCDDGTKPASAALPTMPATRVAGPLVTGAYLQLECELERIVEGFGENGLIVGRVVAARADPAALVDAERDANETLAAASPIAYLHPGRFVAIRDALSFPYPEHMRK
jgi:flavin reductase (DIM6/NTAB) family NADH-FMN oxidoreductase RutF